MNEINECIECKLLSLTYKVLPTSPPDYLHNLIPVQSTCRTRSSSAVSHPSSTIYIFITNHQPLQPRYASPHLWNQLPSSFRQPHSVHSPPGSPHSVHITSSQSAPSLSSPITASTFHSRLSFMRPDSLPRLWRYINLLLTYLLTYLKLIYFTNNNLRLHPYTPP